MVFVKLLLHGAIEQLHVGVGKCGQRRGDRHQALVRRCRQCGQRPCRASRRSCGRGGFEERSSVHHFGHAPFLLLANVYFSARFNSASRSVVNAAMLFSFNLFHFGT